MSRGYRGYCAPARQRLISRPTWAGRPRSRCRTGSACPSPSRRRAGARGRRDVPPGGCGCQRFGRRAAWAAHFHFPVFGSLSSSTGLVLARRMVGDQVDHRDVAAERHVHRLGHGGGRGPDLVLLGGEHEASARRGPSRSGGPALVEVVVAVGGVDHPAGGQGHRGHAQGLVLGHHKGVSSPWAQRVRSSG